MRKALSFVAGAALLAAACAKVTPPVPGIITPRFPDFVAPTVPPDAAGTPAALGVDHGWKFMQANDLKNAEREVRASLKLSPGFYPAESAYGYIELQKKNNRAALAHFERALQAQPTYVSAIVGRGHALVGLGREADALAAFETALKADKSLTDVARRAEVLRFRSMQQHIAGARDAARAGRLDDAIRGYTSAIASSPDSAFLYKELALLERQKGDDDAALQHFRKAAELDPNDAKSLEMAGDILAARNDTAGAERAYRAANAIDPSPDLERKIGGGPVAAPAPAALPAELQAISQANQITRADLAALIGIRLAPLLQATRPEAVVMTDVRSSWASNWIMTVARAGVMDPLDNHQFNPRGVVRRADLAQAVARLLPRVAARNEAQAKAWDAVRLKFSDLSTSHLAYQAASAAVASGVMKAGPGDSFQASRPVSGAEAVESVSKLEALAGLK